MYYVNIEHLSDDQLAVLGYTLIAEIHDFKLYRHYSGDEHVVDNAGPRFLYVDDLNDAVAMHATEIVQLPNV